MTASPADPLPVGLAAELACIYEVLARKPGNVHRSADSADTGLVDFLASAAAIRPVFEHAGSASVGRTVLDAIRATRRVASSNTNLGIVLLLAPLAVADCTGTGQWRIDPVLDSLTVADACAVYEAIRLARPGGLGRVEEGDVGDEPTGTLRQMMALAADRDTIARQYVSGFSDVLNVVAPAIHRGIGMGWPAEDAIIDTYLRLLAAIPDSLIQRKRGEAVAREVSSRAADVLAAGWPDAQDSATRLFQFDAWLRHGGINPGTSADLIAAGLFVLLRDGRMPVPDPAGWTSSRLGSVGLGWVSGR